MLREPWIPRRSRESEESVESFIVRCFGRESFERVGEPLLAGIHCGDASRLSMDVLFPRLVAMEARYGSVTRGMAAAGASGTLIEALSGKLPDDNVLLEEAVEDVRLEGGRFVANLTSGETIHVKVVVLALPISATRGLVRRRFPAVAEILERIKTVSSAVVFHAFAKDDVQHPLDGYGFVVPEGESNLLLAATFVTTKFPGRAPRSGGARSVR